ncbi:MAG: ABC transporter permease [Bacillota bacterium]
MNKVLSVARREVSAYLYTPMAYAVMAGFLLITGYFFSVSVLGSRMASVHSTLGNAGLILVFVAPILTMRLLADEMQQSTSEVLFTTPVTTSQVIAGKFLGSLTIITALIAIMMLYPLVLDHFGDPDWGATLSAYLGLWLMAGSFLAAGVFTSSLTDSQLVAGVSGVALLLLLWVIDWAGSTLGEPLQSILSHISVTQHFLDFNRGIIDTQHIVFYITLSTAFLFLSGRVLESRQWR